MAAVVQINSVSNSGGSLEVTGFIVLSGSYPTGGDVLNFATATADPSYIGLLPAVQSLAVLNLDVWSMNGSQVGANFVNYSPICTKTGTPALINPATGCKLKCAALGTENTEHSAGAYESQYTGDLIAFMATFLRNV